jgi:hypothetical protein
MAEGPEERRRYSEQEFAVILRKASELQEAKDSGPGAGRGLSLAEIKQIAEEAGIDPALVTQAASMLAASGEMTSEGTGLFGSPATMQMRSALDRELSQDDLTRLMEVVRYEVRQPGTVHEVLGSVAWKSDSKENPLEVRLTPRDGMTIIEILADQATSKALFHLAGGAGGIIPTMVVMSALGFEKPLILLGLVIGPLLGTLVARPLWTSYAKRWRQRMARLMDMLHEEADLRALPGGDADET